MIKYLLLLLISSTCFAEPPEIALLEDETFASGDYATRPPDQFFIKLTKHPMPLGTSQQDALFDRYIENLQRLTDATYPDAKNYRKPLYASFSSMIEYLTRATKTNIGHEVLRTPARVEWLIYRGGDTGFQYDSEDESITNGNYRPELIEKIGVAIGTAHINPGFEKLDTSS
jgi:hypothetical protein